MRVASLPQAWKWSELRTVGREAWLLPSSRCSESVALRPTSAHDSARERARPHVLVDATTSAETYSLTGSSYS